MTYFIWNLHWETRGNDVQYLQVPCFQLSSSQSWNATMAWPLGKPWWINTSRPPDKHMLISVTEWTSRAKLFKHTKQHWQHSVSETWLDIMFHLWCFWTTVVTAKHKIISQYTVIKSIYCKARQCWSILSLVCALVLAKTFPFSVEMESFYY